MSWAEIYPGKNWQKKEAFSKESDKDETCVYRPTGIESYPEQPRFECCSAATDEPVHVRRILLWSGLSSIECCLFPDQVFGWRGWGSTWWDQWRVDWRKLFYYAGCAKR